MNIILIGMRGSGKTTIGKALAKILDFGFIETDELIVAKSEFSTITDIVKEKNWSFFRNLESQIMQDPDITARDDVVIATGGGVVTDGKNIENLKNAKSVFIWLKCSINEIIKRIGNDTSRPLITNSDSFIDDLRKVYKAREQLYKKYADIIISSEEKAETVADNIIAKLKEKTYYD
ncbi:shikimate kinase [Candidatus Gottesmanbacteria bacterium]|nr:shikimate kinase [Candidatus Gottesmanbacteria bacterium]